MVASVVVVLSPVPDSVAELLPGPLVVPDSNVVGTLVVVPDVVFEVEVIAPLSENDVVVGFASSPHAAT